MFAFASIHAIWGISFASMAMDSLAHVVDGDEAPISLIEVSPEKVSVLVLNVTYRRAEVLPFTSK